MAKIYTGFLLVLVLLTNRYLYVVSDSGLLPPDSFSYLSIAEAFPSLPSSELHLPFHHAQRFVLPYFVGGVSRVTHIHLETVFRVFVLVSIFGLLTIMGRILGKISKLTIWQRSWILALLILNPYSFRIYLAAPFLLNDLFFQLGLMMLLLGLWERSVGFILAGITLAVSCRQTGVLLVFPSLLWLRLLWPMDNWKWSTLVGGVGCLIAFAVYHFTAFVASGFAGGNSNVAHVMGLVSWIQLEWKIGKFSEFLLRGGIGLVFPIAVFLSVLPKFGRSSSWTTSDLKRLACLAGYVAIIAAQPILGGPGVTGRDITRLVMLGIGPGLVALGVAISHTNLKSTFWERAFPLLTGAGMVGSFHHMYSFLGIGNGSERTNQFAIVHFICGFVLYLGLRASVSYTGRTAS